MRTNNLILILSFLIFGCGQDNSNQKTTISNWKSDCDSIGSSLIDQKKILGFSVTIDSAGSTIYNGSFGHIDLNKTIPVDQNTRFDIASISKMIGATVIMKLIEEGKLNLDQTLDDILPEFPDSEQAKRIKLGHLISHTSGLLDYSLEIDSVFMETGKVPLKQNFLAFFDGKDLLFEPGSNYQYCNSGFMLMAFIAENATGKPWQELINEFINEPNDLDFQLIRFASDLSTTSPLFNFQNDSFLRAKTLVYVIGDGGLTATTEMLSKFPRLLTNDEFMSQSMFEQMSNPRLLNDGTKTGYGFGVRNGFFLEERIIGHTGGWKSTYAIMVYFPEREITFTALMNTDDTPDDIYLIFSKFMSVYLNKSFPDYTSSLKKFENPELILGSYHGFGDEYDNEGTTVNIKLEEGKLFYCVNSSCDQLYYMGENRFWLERYPYDFIEFEMGGNYPAIKEYYYGLFQVIRLKTE